MTNRINFQCEFCGHLISTREESIGKKGQCPKCKKIVIISANKTDTPLEMEVSFDRFNQIVEQAIQFEIKNSPSPLQSYLLLLSLYGVGFLFIFFFSEPFNKFFKNINRDFHDLGFFLAIAFALHLVAFLSLFLEKFTSLKTDVNVPILGYYHKMPIWMFLGMFNVLFFALFGVVTIFVSGERVSSLILTLVCGLGSLAIFLMARNFGFLEK